MNLSIRRLSSAAVLSVLCACTVGAGLAWACVPPGWGWSAPSTPEATPTTGADAGAVAPAPSPDRAPSSTLAPAESTQPGPPQSNPPQSGSGQPSPDAPARTPAQQPATSPADTPSRGLVPAVTQQRSGAQSSGAIVGTPARPRSTAGSDRAGDARSDQTSKAKKGSAPARSTAATVQAATDGDAWSGAGGKSPSLMPSASDPAAPTAGAGVGLGAGLLGLGLVGLFGGLAVAETRRRRAPTRR